MDQRRQRVIIETDRHRVTGEVTMPADGYRSRLSDYFNNAEREFISLTSAVVEPLSNDGGRELREFVVISRRHIVLAMPADDHAGADA